MIRMQVQLTEEQANALRRMAAREGVPIAELIRQGIARRLAENDRHERRRRALAAAGRLRGGPSDLGRRHDAYLDDAFGVALSA
jgi:hypothetical protein